MATADDDHTLQQVQRRDGPAAGAVVISMLPSEPASFCIRREDAGGLPVIVLEGELDLATAPRLAAELDSFSSGDVITVDLCSLDFMDCAGVRELMRASAVLGDGLHVVCGRQGPARRLFDAAAVEQLLSVYPSRAAALRAVRSPDAGSRPAWHRLLRHQSGVRAVRVGRRREV